MSKPTSTKNNRRKVGVENKEKKKQRERMKIERKGEKGEKATNFLFKY